MSTIEKHTFFSRVFFILLLLFGALFIPEVLFATASAAEDTAISGVICNVVQQLTGPIGQALSTVAVIFIGIGLFMGKISWGLALGIAVGMAMLFGAQNVVGWISGGSFICKTIDYTALTK